MQRPEYKLSPRFQSQLIGISRAAVDLPDSLDRDAIEARLLKNVAILFFQMQKFNRLVIRVIYFFFERLPFFFGCGPHRFSKLKIEKQKRYLDKWLNHRFVWFRDMGKAVRGVVMVIYFSDRDIWKYLDYDPLTHIRKRIQLREEILKRS